MRIILSLVLAVSAIVGASAPASAAKAKATLTVSSASAFQGSTATVTLTGAAYTGSYWDIEYYADGTWNEFCWGKSKTKQGVLKCVGPLPLEGSNTFRASCDYCGPSFETIFSNKKVIKGNPAPGSPKNPVAKGKFMDVGESTKKIGVLKLASTNWNATVEFCRNFTNYDVYIFGSSTGPCRTSSVRPEICEPTCDEWQVLDDRWKPRTAVPNPSYAKKLVSIKLTYKQTSSGSGYVPDLEFRQANGSYVDSLDSSDYPSSEAPEGLYFYEKTIKNSAVSRTAYFAVAKSISSGHLVIRGYDFGRFATKGLYEEAWMKTKQFVTEFDKDCGLLITRGSLQTKNGLLKDEKVHVK